jgi:3-dehydroquinate synthase class II
VARKLPDPSERSDKEPMVLCSGDRVLALYNKAQNKTAQRVSKEVRKWFLETAEAEGWNAAIFIKDVETASVVGFAGTPLHICEKNAGKKLPWCLSNEKDRPDGTAFFS